MLFSVVIPVFNRRELLPRTLASLWAQRFTDYETIVVDDGSTDGTREYLDGLGERIRLIRQANRGPGAARNAGAAAARGEYVSFLDSDDLWFPWTLEVFASIIAEAAPSLLTASYFDWFDDAQLASIRETAPRHRVFRDFLSSSADNVTVGASTMVIKRPVLAASGGFTERLINGEDHDLILRLGTAAGFAQVLAPMTLAWRRHQGNVTTVLDRTIEGMKHLVDQERNGHYPGEAERAGERRRIITRHVRPWSLECLRRGRVADGVALYRSTLPWNVAAGHWRYVAAFPLMSVWASLRGAS